MASGTLDIDELVARLSALPRNRRHVVAVAGPPGSGKSTVSDALLHRLNANDPGRAAILPMDGYHYDNGLLTEMGLLARKGAPETFDVGGFAQINDGANSILLDLILMAIIPSLAAMALMDPGLLLLLWLCFYRLLKS